MHDSEDPRIKISENNFIALGEWLSALEQLPANSDDRWIAKSLLKFAHRAYAHLRIGVIQDSTYCAWACRNLLELRIFVKWLLHSSAERKRFCHDFYIDSEQQTEAQKMYFEKKYAEQPGIDEDLGEMGVERWGSRDGGREMGVRRNNFLSGQEMGVRRNNFLSNAGEDRELFRLTRISTRISRKIQGDDLRQPIAPHVKSFAVLQALEESKLLIVHLEKLGVAFPVEGGIFEE
jgi:hypothetical protein